MAATKRVPLSRLYEAHGSTTPAALIREPTGALYLDHGEPFESQRSVDGAIVVIENRLAIRAYIEACVAFEGGADAYAVLAQLELADIRAVKDGVLDFFRAARGGEATSASSSISSPSAPDGPRPTSSD